MFTIVWTIIFITSNIDESFRLFLSMKIIRSQFIMYSLILCFFLIRIISFEMINFFRLMKQTSSKIARIKNFYVRKCQNFVFSFAYSIISKCISFRNFVVAKMILINFIKLYQYCQTMRIIFCCCRRFFLRFVNKNIFSIIINTICRINCNKNKYRRFCRLNESNLNDNILITFS